MKRGAWLLLLLLAAPTAAAQDEPRPSLTLVPVAREAAPGEAFDITLELWNPRDAPMHFRLGATNDAGVAVRFASPNVTVDAATSLRVPVTLKTPASVETTYVVHFLAEEVIDAPRAATYVPARLEATLDITTTAGPTIEVDRPENTGRSPLYSEVRVLNRDDHPVEWQLSAEAPAGISVEFQPPTLVARAKGEARSTIVIRGEGHVPAATIPIVATETDASARANARAPSVVKGALEIPPPPTTPRPPPAIDIQVVPQTIELPENGSASATLVVTNRADTSGIVSLEVRVPPGFRAARIPAQRIPVGETAEVPFVLVHEGAPVIDKLVGASAWVPGREATEAAFAIRVVPLAAGTNVIEHEPPAAFASNEALVAAGVVAGAAAGWTALWLTRRHWWPFLLLLYTRLRPSKMLDHPVRRKIADVVQAQPGVTFSELARAVGIAPGQLTHHARMLEKAGVVFSSPDGQTRRFFHVGAGRLAPVPPLAERALSMLAQGPRTTSELARELGVSRQALHYHVKQLVAEGKLVARAEGRETWLEAASSAQPSSAAGGLARS